MDKELLAKFYNDECFRNFCSMVDELRKNGQKIDTPFNTAILLRDAKIDYVRDNEDIEVIHNHTKYFLNNDDRGISKETTFYDYLVITSIMWIADAKREQIEGNRWRQLPLDLTEYARNICKFDACSCGYKPKIVFLSFINCLTGKVICEKCGLSVSILFTHEADIFHGDFGTVYVNLERGIEKLADSWNKEVAKIR